MYAATVFPLPHPAFTNATRVVEPATAVWNARGVPPLNRCATTASKSPDLGLSANDSVIHSQGSFGFALGSADPATSAATRQFLTAATNRASGEPSSRFQTRRAFQDHAASSL